jgi:hypothetical protein
MPARLPAELNFLVDIQNKSVETVYTKTALIRLGEF